MPKVISLSSSSQHAMLLYDNNSNRDIASINYINQGLEQKLLCIYASVNAYNTLRRKRQKKKPVNCKSETIL